jgi:type II secretory pathway component GspD/PulD (secretin)
MIIERSIGNSFYRIIQLWIVVCLVLVGSTATTLAQENVPDIVVENGTVMLPIVHGNEQAVTGLLPYVQQMPEFANMTMTLLQPKGAPAMVLLSGSDESWLRAAATKLQGLLSEGGRPHRLIISAYLRELDIANNHTTGIDWSSITGNFTAGISQLNRVVSGKEAIFNKITGQWVPQTPGIVTDTIAFGLAAPPNAYYGFDAQFTRSLSKSRVIMGSNLYTPNGIQGEILSQTIVPLQTTDSNGNATLTSQTISSDVKITPTIVKYNAENPSESVIRLDIYMQMALITGSVPVGNSSAKEFSTKTLTTMGFVKPNSSVYVVGVFAGDTETTAVTGIPVLMNIPILKYLFSQTTKQLTHKVGVLTVSVRILPEGY